MARKVQGQVSLKVGSTLLKSKFGATLSLGGAQRSAVPNDQRTIDYQEGEVAPSVIEAVLVVDDQFDTAQMDSWVDERLTFTADNGLVFSITGATLESKPTISNGEAPVTFFGNEAEQLG